MSRPTRPPAICSWPVVVLARGLGPVSRCWCWPIWWRRANRWGAMAGLLAGFAVAAYLIAASASIRRCISISSRPGSPISHAASAPKWHRLAAVPAGVCLAIAGQPRDAGAGRGQRAIRRGARPPRDIPSTTSGNEPFGSSWRSAADRDAHEHCQDLIAQRLDQRGRAPSCRACGRRGARPPRRRGPSARCSSPRRHAPRSTRLRRRSRRPRRPAPAAPSR